MRFDEKARENLEAAERLLPDDSGDRDPLCASASRSYYAAYLAVADAAQKAGFGFTSDRDYYRHDALADDVLEWGLLDAERASELALLLGSRVKADYWEDDVELEEASEAHAMARTIVSALLEVPS